MPQQHVKEDVLIGLPETQHKTRGDQGRLAAKEHVAPQSEVIRAIVLEDSPCVVRSQRTGCVRWFSPDPH